MATYSINLTIDGKSNIQALLASAGRDIDNFVSKVNKMNTGQGSTKGMDNQRAAIKMADQELAKYQKSLQNITGPSINTNKFDAGLKKIQNNTKTTTTQVNRDLQAMGANVNFNNISNKFEASMRKVLSTAASTAKGVGTYISNIDSATAALGAVGGGYSANQIFDYGMGRATMQTMLKNMGKQDFYSPYQRFTQMSSTSDQDIVRMFQAIMTTPGLQSSQVYSALNAADAASYSADPVQRYRDMFAYSSYIQGGWEQAGRMLRDEGLSQAEQDKLQAASTPQERIDALNEIAKTRGKVDEFGNSLSTTTEGPMANYNTVLAAADTLMRGMAKGMNDLIAVVAPLGKWFLSLDTTTQDLIGKLVFFGGALATGTAALGVFSKLVPDFLKDKISNLLGNKTTTPKMDVTAGSVNVNGKTTGGTGTNTVAGEKGGGLTGAAIGIGAVTLIAYGAVNVLQQGIKTPETQQQANQTGPATTALTNYWGNADLTSPWGFLGNVFGIGKDLIYGPGPLAKQAEQEKLNQLQPKMQSNMSGSLGWGNDPVSQWINSQIGGLGTNLFKTPDWLQQSQKGSNSFFGGLFGGVSAAGSGGNKGISNDIFGKNGLLDMSRFKMPQFKLPTAQQILTQIITKLHIPQFKIPTLGSISQYIQSKIPKVNWQIPTRGEVGQWIQNHIPTVPWHIPSLSDVGNYINSHIPTINWQIPSYTDVYNAIVSRIPSFSWPSGPGGVITGMVHRAKDALSNPIGTVTNIGGSLYNAINPFSGPGDHPLNKLNYVYEDYAGHKEGRPYFDGTTLMGNCFDMSLGMRDIMGGGSIIPTTWNGHSHAYYKDHSGKVWDGANRAITGSFDTPPKGPSGTDQKGVYIDLRKAKIYDGPSFKKTIKGIMDEYSGEIIGF